MAAPSKEKGKTSADSKPVSKSTFAFGRENYMLMIVGVIIILIGFALMSGGKSEDPNVFNPEIFSTRRIIIAPAVVLIGFVVEVFAIFRKSKD